VLETERVDRVRSAAGVEHEAREHRVVRHAGQLDARVPQHLPIVLDVVGRFLDRGILEQRDQRGQGDIGDRRQVRDRRGGGQLARLRHMAEREIPDLGRAGGQ